MNTLVGSVKWSSVSCFHSYPLIKLIALQKKEWNNTHHFTVQILIQHK